ncbi:MAG: nitroreductase family protein [Muribaculaceae bacterium]|nr:nitroreductase family protein [Muribaculaceae bacterium]
MNINNNSENLAINNNAYQNILTRTSIRNFSNKPIKDELKSALLHAGMSAPSGVNKQPWEFILIDNTEILKQLAETLPYAKMTALAPMAIVVCGNSERFLEGDDSTLWVQDVSAASENILLAAHALGLGAVWTCLYPHPDRMESTSRILHLPNSIVPFNLIPIGYPSKTHAPINKWHPERIHYNHF